MVYNVSFSVLFTLLFDTGFLVISRLIGTVWLFRQPKMGCEKVFSCDGLGFWTCSWGLAWVQLEALKGSCASNSLYMVSTKEFRCGVAWLDEVKSRASESHPAFCPI